MPRHSEEWNMEFANFFENTPTEYSRGATQGTWAEAFEDEDSQSLPFLPHES